MSDYLPKAVQALTAEALAAEREACAKIVYQDAAFRGVYGKAVADRIRAIQENDDE